MAPSAAMHSGSLVEEPWLVSAQRRTTVEAVLPVGDDAMVHLLTLAKCAENVDQAARPYRSMRGEAFTAVWDAGRFDADPAQPALIRVSLVRAVGC